MANAKTLVVGGQPLNVIDDTARSNAQTALNSAEYNRMALIGKYGGQSIETLLAGEIGGGTVYDALHKRIVANNFAGLRVGDYLDVPLVSASGVAGQQSVRFIIAHIDPYLWCDDRGKGHHIAFVASAPIAVSSSYDGVANSSYIPWNETNTNQGTADIKSPYLCSQLKGWETAFEACLPEGLTKYILTQRVLLEERYSASGALTDSNNWSWQDIGKVWSLSEMEVYGCPVWGTPGYSVGFDCQFDLFKDTAHRLNGTRCHWWLRSVRGGSSANVCYVNNNGNANYNDATNDWIRPRVGLLILARQPRLCVGLRAHEEGRADVRARARKDASRWEGSPLLAWPRASALDAVSLLLPKRPGNAGAHRRRPCGMPP